MKRNLIYLIASLAMVLWPFMDAPAEDKGEETYAISLVQTAEIDKEIKPSQPQFNGEDEAKADQKIEARQPQTDGGDEVKIGKEIEAPQPQSDG